MISFARARPAAPCPRRRRSRAAVLGMRPRCAASRPAPSVDQARDADRFHPQKRCQGRLGRWPFAQKLAQKPPLRGRQPMSGSALFKAAPKPARGVLQKGLRVFRCGKTLSMLTISTAMKQSRHRIAALHGLHGRKRDHPSCNLAASGNHPTLHRRGVVMRPGDQTHTACKLFPTSAGGCGGAKAPPHPEGQRTGSWICRWAPQGCAQRPRPGKCRCEGTRYRADFSTHRRCDDAIHRHRRNSQTCVFRLTQNHHSTFRRRNQNSGRECPKSDPSAPGPRSQGPE